MRTDWHGVFTAIVTPFAEDGSLDEKRLAETVKRQIDAGIHGLVPCGTTGEAPAMTEEEWARVIEITVKEADGNAWVVAGTGTNNTAVSAARTKYARELGADGGLVITPYYNKPTVEGIIRHFRFVIEQNPEFPIMVYNVPSRTRINLTVDDIKRLAQFPEIVAVKEASGNLTQVWEMGNDPELEDEIAIFSGDDPINLPIWEIGGDGAVSVLSNLVPELVVKQYNHLDSLELEEAYNLHVKFRSIIKSLFIETSPGPIKYAMNRIGVPVGQVRMPLAPVSEKSAEIIDRDLAELGLL